MTWGVLNVKRCCFDDYSTKSSLPVHSFAHYLLFHGLSIHLYVYVYVEIATNAVQVKENEKLICFWPCRWAWAAKVVVGDVKLNERVKSPEILETLVRLDSLGKLHGANCHYYFRLDMLLRTKFFQFLVIIFHGVKPMFPAVEVGRQPKVSR